VYQFSGAIENWKLRAQLKFKKRLLNVAVLKRRPLMIEPGGLEGGGFESGLLKMGNEGGGSLLSQ